MVSCAAEAGYTHVGLRLIPATPTEVSYATIGDTPIIRDTLARLADTGIAVLDIEILRLKPDTRRRATSCRCSRPRARLGARNALVAGNDPDEARAHRALRRVVRSRGAAGHRAVPRAHAVDRRARLRAGRAHRCATSARANAGLLIDAIHFDRGGSVASEIAGVPPRGSAMPSCATRRRSGPPTVDGLLHQARAERLLPGEGGLDLAGILRALPRDTPLSARNPAGGARADGAGASSGHGARWRRTHALLDRLGLPVRADTTARSRRP